MYSAQHLSEQIPLINYLFFHTNFPPTKYVARSLQSLTVQPCVRDGKLTHMDSPLVVAVKEGSVLLLDEADKAPTHVTCVLKVRNYSACYCCRDFFEDYLFYI